VEYPSVPHSHVVPKGYLHPWVVDGRIAMRRPGLAASVPISLRDAGVRRNFYRRTRPETGEAIYDIEWSLQQAEDVAIPVVRGIVDRWPLGGEDKSKAAQFFALQYLRGPAFKAWHQNFVDGLADDLRMRDPREIATPPDDMTHQEAVERYIEHLKSDTYRAVRMLNLVRGTGAIFGSMHWTLVEFAKGSLAASDHPVVVWPLARGTARPVANDLDAGLLDTLEVFVPVSPSHLLLMTWLHDKDSPMIQGVGRQLATASAFVVSNAEKQWFHQPGTDPWLPRGPRAPLSRALIPAYGTNMAAGSPRRSQVTDIAKSLAGAPLENEGVVPMVSISGSP
jgi:hypothetical protein